MYLDPLTLAKLGSLKIRARCVVEGFLTGLHKTKIFGYSQEFAQHRPYSYGDEIKFIDWKLYGRFDRLFVKQFQSEMNLKAYIVLDSSGSMGYSSNTISKLEYAKTVAAVLAYLLISQNDYVGMVSFDKEVKEFIPPRLSDTHLSTLLDTLEKIAPGGETAISSIMNRVGTIIKRRGLLILISDLFDNAESVVNSLKNLVAKRQELVVIQVIDIAEQDFPFKGEVILKMTEPPYKMVDVDSEGISIIYKRKFAEFLNFYKQNLQDARIPYFLANTTMPIEHILNSLFG